MMDNAAVLIAGAGGLTLLGELARGETPRAAVMIGTAGAGALVMLLGMANEQLAHGLALVVFLTALLTSGYDLAAGIGRALNR